MASHEPSLTVLTGPLAGQKLALGGSVDNILIGADPSCAFHLPTAGVSPIHARLWIDASGATVYDTNSPRGLYVNDDRVNGQAALHNGDILWLGTPGEEEALMIQVVLPPPGQPTATVPRPIPQELMADTLNLPGAAGVPPEPEVVEVVDELPPAEGEPTTFLEGVGAQTAPVPLPSFVPSIEEPAPEETVAAEVPAFEAPEETAFLQVPEEASVEPAGAPAYEETVAAEETAFLQVPGEEPPPVEVLAEPVAETYEDTVAAEVPSFEAPEETAFLQVPAEAPAEATAFLQVPEPEPFFVEPEPPAFVETRALPQPEELVAAPPEVPSTPAPRFTAPEPEPVRFEVELPRATPVPVVEFDDDTEVEAAAAAPATILMKASPIAPPPAPTPAPPEPAAPATILMTASPIAPAPAPAPAPKAPPRPAPGPAPAVPARPPAPKPPAPKVAAPKAPAPAPKPAARPTPPPMPAPLPPPAPPVARKSGPPVVALAIGGVALVLLAGGGFLGYRMMSGPATPPVTAPATLPATQPPASVAEAPPTSAPEPAVEEGVTIVGQPTPRPVTPPSGAPSAVPPTTLAKGKPTPPPTASTVPAVDPAAVKAQQVAGLLGQAEASMAARSYDAAIGHYEEALKLDPENAKALAGKASAASLRDAAKRAFVTGRTVVIPAKQEKGALAGFEGAAVQKAPDFSGRMEFAVSPAQVKPGDTIRIQVALTNDGKKTIKVAGVALAVTLNGKKGEVPFNNSAKEIEPGQKVILGEVPFVWPEGVTFWAAEATVSANKGDSLRAQVTWK